MMAGAHVDEMVSEENDDVMVSLSSTGESGH